MSAAPSPQVLPRSSLEFTQMVSEFRVRLQTDIQLAALLNVLCGSAARVETLTGAPAGLGLSAFAALMELPTTTLRHYQRLGLITPYQVNGKFRFWVHNVLQVESVRQWRGLGLSLEEILAQREESRLGTQAATFNRFAPAPNTLDAEKTLTVSLAQPTSISPNQHGPWTIWLPPGGEGLQFTSRQAFRDTEHWSLDLARLLAEVRAARSRLEDRLALLQAQLERARALEAALGESQP